MSAWLAAHLDDIAVNVISNIPFLLFDLVVIALVLPVTIEFVRLAMSRRTRGTALSDIFHLLNNSSHFLRTRLEAIQGDGWDLSLRDRAVETIRRSRQNIADQMPILVTVLDPSSMNVVLNAHRALDGWLELLEEVVAVSECMPAEGIDYFRGTQLHVETALMELRLHALRIDPTIQLLDLRDGPPPLWPVVKAAHRILEDQCLADEKADKVGRRRRRVLTTMATASAMTKAQKTTRNPNASKVDLATPASEPT